MFFWLTKNGTSQFILQGISSTSLYEVFIIHGKATEQNDIMLLASLLYISLYFSCQLWAQQNQDAVCTGISNNSSRQLVATTTKILSNPLSGPVHASVSVLKVDPSNIPLTLQGSVNEIKKMGVLNNLFYSKGKLHRVLPIQHGFRTESYICMWAGNAVAAMQPKQWKMGRKPINEGWQLVRTHWISVSTQHVSSLVLGCCFLSTHSQQLAKTHRFEDG